MASPFTELGDWKLIDGYVADVIRGMGGDFMARGSENGMVSGTGMTRAFRGPLLVAGKIGSRLLFNTDQSYAGLGTGIAEGVGSVFNIRQLLAAIGSGQVNFAGAAIAGFLASSTLSFVKKAAGVYAVGALTGPFQAGHAQPEAPFIYAKDNPSAGFQSMSGAVVMFQWRVSSITGQVSLASLPSNVLVLSNQDVIAELAAVDANGQDIIGLGVVKLGFRELGVGYELPISLGGEVLESTLAYSRAAGNVTFTNASDTAVISGGVTSADVGRRLSSAAFDTWITEIVDGTHAKIHDLPGATTTLAATIRHAVDGILRAVEVSWTNEALFGQDLIPDKAFPPVAAQFSGVMNDTVWIDADGIIYVGEPGQIGSFPPKNAIFGSEPAICYLAVEDGVTLRWCKTRVGALYYVGGRPSIEHQTVIENQGILFPQNVFLGYGGRVCVWLGKPTVVSNTSFEPDFEYAARVMSEFDGWAEGQTAIKPIAGGYDGLGQFECWCLGKKVMARHGPSGKWCSPTDLTGKVSGDIIDAVTVNIAGVGHALYLSCLNGAGAMTLYQYDAGTGSVMKIQTSDVSRMNYGGDVTMVMSEGRVDNLNNPVRIQIVPRYKNATPLADPLEGLPAQTPTETGDVVFALREPNAIDAGAQHSVLVTMTSEGGNAGVNRIKTFGSTEEVETR